MLLFLACATTEDEPVRPVFDRPPDVLYDTGDVVSAGAPTEDGAEIVSTTFPCSIACDESDLALVIVRNTGTTTWTWPDYKLGTVGDEDPLHPSDTRVWLGEGDVVEPGESYAFSFDLVAPADPGTYTTDWQMVHEGVQWFGGQASQAVSVECETGGWVCGDGARNGDEVCDDAWYDVPSPAPRVALWCEEATGGIAYFSTNTGPPCSDGVSRCQGWEENGQNAWDYLDYIASITCDWAGQYVEVDLSRYAGRTIYVGAHTQPDGSGRMTWGCVAEWTE